MAPALEPGDGALVLKGPWASSRRIRIGDVVVFRAPTTRHRPESRERSRKLFPGTREHIKRVAGLGGDTIQLRKGQLWIDDRDSGLLFFGAADHGPVQVPPGHLFVLGDNAGVSEDSREHGVLPAGSIVGRAICVIWPRQRIGWVERRPPDPRTWRARTV